MTMEITTVPPLEDLAVTALKDGSATSVAKPTAIDDMIKDTWSQKQVGAGAASGHSSSTDLLISPIFKTKIDVADAANFVTLDALAKKDWAGGDFKIKSMVEDPNTALQQAIMAAQADAAQRVLNEPQWEHDFIRSISASNRAMREHPNLADELSQARTSLSQSNEDLLAKNKKIDRLISDHVPADNQYLTRLVHTLVDSEPGSNERGTLRKLYPDIYQQAIERDGLTSRYDNAQRNCYYLDSMNNDATNSRLNYASFLDRRGARGDSREMAHQLADIVRIDPNVVNPYSNHPQFHDVRDLARKLDAKDREIFEDAFTRSRQAIPYDSYFSPKFDRYLGPKYSEMKFPKEPFHYAPAETFNNQLKVTSAD